MLAIREFINGLPDVEKLNKNDLERSKIKPEHFEIALKQIKPTSKEMLDKYTAIAERFSNIK